MSEQYIEPPIVGTYEWWETQAFPALDRWTVGMAESEERAGRPLVVSGDRTARWVYASQGTPPW